jgi:hypothetical protein
MLRLRLLLALPFLAVTSSLRAEDDPVKEKLEKKKADYEVDIEKYHRAVTEYFDRRETAARNAGNKKLVDQIKAERQTFTDDGELPKAAPAALRQGRAAVRAKLAAAYEVAVKEYTRAKKDDAAAEAEGELRLFKASKSDDSVGWTSLADRKALPDPFAALPQASFSRDGVTTGGRFYAATKGGDYLAKDFKFELVYTLRNGTVEDIIFVGIGSAARGGQFNEPKESVFLAIHPPNVIGGEIQLAGAAAGKVAKEGTHRVTIEKKGDAVTFAIDIDNKRKPERDVAKKVEDIKKAGPFLTDKNTHIFFGGGGVFKQFRLTEKP